MKIVILDGGTVNPGDISWAPLESLGEVSVYSSTPKEKEMCIRDSYHHVCAVLRGEKKSAADCCAQIYICAFDPRYCGGDSQLKRRNSFGSSNGGSICHFERESFLSYSEHSGSRVSQYWPVGSSIFFAANGNGPILPACADSVRNWHGADYRTDCQGCHACSQQAAK